MQFLATLIAISGLAAATVHNSSREYTLHTQVKKNNAATKQFNGLYLYSYHTGAGLGDATVDTNGPNVGKGFLNNTNSHGVGNQLFDLGSDFPWNMETVYNEVFYAGWQPVRINAGGAGGTEAETFGYFLNKTGLQYTSTPQAPGGVGDMFGGWLVCDWWHGVPQLFARLAGYNTPAPASCADVFLMPKYL